ncbi:MAG: PAS domain S-box protein, partial [Methanocalculus sp. MSAO_Arc2]
QQVEELSVARQEIEESREQLELAMDAGEHGFWDWNLLTNEAYFSPRYYTMLGYDPGEFPPGFESWLSLLHPDDREFVVPIVEGCVREMQPFEEDFRLRCKDGSWRWISGRGKIYQSKTGGHPTRALGVQVDIHDRKLTALALQKKNEELHAAYEQLTASEEELRHNLDELAGQELALRRKKTELEERYRFEELVRQIVSRFIKTDDFDQNITESLTDIGTYCGASRSYIFEFRGVEEVMDNTYEWCAENVSPEIDNLQNLPTTLFPWWMAHLRNGEMIHIPDISLLLPEASAEREILEPQGIKSIIILPLTIKERLIGFIGLDNVQGTEEWSDEAVALLRIYSDFLGNAFERRHNWRALQDQNRALLEAKEQIAASEEEIRTQLDEKIAIQHQLDLSEEQYRAIFEHTKTPAVIIDEDTSISLANSAFAAISGYSPEEVIGRSWTEFVSKSDLEVMISYRRKRREEGADSPTQYEFSFINRYGDPRNIHLTIGMLPGTRQLVASFHDITEPKQTEKALRESEEKYRLIAENTVDNIWIFDMDFRLSYISPSVLTMKGFTVEESLAQTAEEMMTPASYASLLARFNLEMELEATGTADPDRNVSFETEEYCKDGSTIKVENSTRLLRDDEGRPVGILGISRDITNRKAAEEALHTANKKLQLLSSITRHDIMNKIMTLHAYLDLTMPMIDDPILTGYLTEAEKAATAIQKQIEFTRIYENLGVHTPTWQPLSPLIEAIDHTRLPIHHDCGEFSVYADPMFEKVLQNLYDNTLRHAEGADCVRIRCEDQDGNLIITWEDNGPGVPEELKERIFDK